MRPVDPYAALNTGQYSSPGAQSPSHSAALNPVPVRVVERALPAALPARRIGLDAIAAAAVFVALAGLYLKTAAPGVYSFDAAEFSIAAATWGIPHATGYPLFLLLGRLFITALPFVNVAFRMAIATAVFAALTPATLYLVLRELRVDWRASLLACAAFGISYYQWASAVVTKEHSLHDWLLALVLLCLLRWQRAAGFRWLLAATVVYGLSLTNHLAAALYGPAFLGFVIWTARRHTKSIALPSSVRLTIWRWLALAAVFLLSLLPYLYLPLVSLTNPAFNIAGQFDANGVFQPVDLASWEGMAWMLTARQFAGAVAGSPMNQLPLQLLELGQWLWGNFLGVGVLLGIAGIHSFHSRNRAFFWTVAAVAALHLAFFVRYDVGDRDSMFVPLYVIWTLTLAFGIDWVVRELAWRSAAHNIVAGLLGIAILGGAAANYGLLDLSSDQRPHDYAMNLLARVPPNATILTRWAFSGPLRYEQLIEGQRPDVQVIDSFLIPPRDLQQFVQQNIERRTLVVDDVSLLPQAYYPGICGMELPGSDVNLAKFPSSSGQPPSYPGFTLVRCIGFGSN